MADKAHIINELRAEFDRWEAFLADLREAQIATPSHPTKWSIKDNIAHLWAWQQRTIARMEAAVHGKEPEFPAWPSHLDPEIEREPDELNAWLYEQYRESPWPQVYQRWRTGYLHLIELAEAVPEPALMQPGYYTWMGEHPLALMLTASGDHHAEHRSWLFPKP